MRQFPHGVVLGVALLAFWLLVGTLGFMWIEGWNFLDALYMTVITISTVGFTEVHPLSEPGRLFATVLIVGGLGTAVYTFTRLGQLVLEGELLGILGRRKMHANLDRLRNHVIVCGYGRIGKPVAEGLARVSHPFCVVDRDLERADELRERGFLHLIGDATDEDVLQAAGVERARAVMALLPSDADNLYITISAKMMNPAVQVIARAMDEKAEMKLKRSGADRVVSPNQIAAARVLHSALRPAVVDFMELVTHREVLPLNLEEIRIAEGSELANQTLQQAQIRRRCGAIVVAIKKENGEMQFNPGPEAVLEPGDVLVAMGQEAGLKNLERLARG